MKQVIDQAILFLFCLTTLLLVKADTSFITAMLAAIIISSANNIYSSKKCNMMTMLIYIVLSLLYPDMLLFLPLTIYNTIIFKNYRVLAAVTIVFLGKIIPLSFPLFLLLTLGLCLAFLLVYRTTHYVSLEERYKKTRDDSTELNLLLKQKNQGLLDKQDYEIYTATLRERNRIAREIHDNVGHMLSRSILMIGAMKAIHTDSSLKEPLTQLDETLNAAMTSIRNSVHDLHNDSVNLKETMEGLIATFSFCDIQMDYDMSFDIPRNIKYSFISITREALNNIIKHSNASHVHIVVREHPGLYQLIIEDNGQSAAPSTDGGLGLLNMKDRIEALDGTIQIKTTKGFCIFITIPKKESHK